VWADPTHPYTEALVSAIPRADGLGALPVDLPGDVPDPGSPPSGCRFHPRCPLAEDRCSTTVPLLTDLPPEYDRAAACLVRVPADS
jgi:peptide/nickel transport system ATP-binding protein